MLAATEIFCLNELGRRSNNEDHVSPRKGKATLNDRLFIVCDGVGGEKKGEVASGIVCRSIHEYIHRHPVVAGREKEVIHKSIHNANTNLAAYAADFPGAKRMSTTLALVLLGHRSVTAAWCGDSRIHHIRNGRILWRSKDHSLVGELVSQGELTEEEARKHPQRNVITRSLNALNYNNAVDFYEIENVLTGDYLLLCTDGFLEQINDQLIQDVLLNQRQKDKAESFFSFCNGVTKDNFSMYLIRVHYSDKRKPSSRSETIVKMVILLLLVCLAAFFFFRKLT